MSNEEEGFLNRWSRRKQEAAKEEVQQEAEPEKIEEASVESKADADAAPEEEFDISKLPPVESITAGTDIRAFLSKDVPAALTQAALRRAWTADPAIRDYIGLSEYSWDFNAPGTYGFGPLDPSLNVQDMVADIFGKVKQAAEKVETLSEPQADVAMPQTDSALVSSEPLRSVELRSESGGAEPAREVVSAHAEIETGDKNAQARVAPQQTESESERDNLPVRRHGSALPT